jgi:hypothetical protein
VQIADYSEGDVIESDHVIGMSGFTFMAWFKPHSHHYSMILSRDRRGDPKGIFRVPMWSDDWLGVTEVTAFARDGAETDPRDPPCDKCIGAEAELTS